MGDPHWSIGWIGHRPKPHPTDRPPSKRHTHAISPFAHLTTPLRSANARLTFQNYFLLRNSNLLRWHPHMPFSCSLLSHSWWEGGTGLVETNLLILTQPNKSIVLSCFLHYNQPADTAHFLQPASFLHHNPAMSLSAGWTPFLMYCLVVGLVGSMVGLHLFATPCSSLSSFYHNVLLHKESNKGFY